MDKVVWRVGSVNLATVMTKYLGFMHLQIGQTTPLRTLYVDNVWL